MSTWAALQCWVTLTHLLKWKLEVTDTKLRKTIQTIQMNKRGNPVHRAKFWMAGVLATNMESSWIHQQKKEGIFLLCYNVLEIMCYLHSCYSLPNVLPTELLWSPNLLLQTFVINSAVQVENKRRAPAPKALITMKMKSLLEDSKP